MQQKCAFIIKFVALRPGKRKQRCFLEETYSYQDILRLHTSWAWDRCGIKGCVSAVGSYSSKTQTLYCYKDKQIERKMCTCKRNMQTKLKYCNLSSTFSMHYSSVIFRLIQVATYAQIQQQTFRRALNSIHSKMCHLCVGFVEPRTLTLKKRQGIVLIKLTRRHHALATPALNYIYTLPLMKPLSYSTIIGKGRTVARKEGLRLYCEGH